MESRDTEFYHYDYDYDDLRTTMVMMIRMMKTTNRKRTI